MIPLEPQKIKKIKSYHILQKIILVPLFAKLDYQNFQL